MVVGTISNEAAAGADYFTRTAVAKSIVNGLNETKYFYRDLGAAGIRLNGANRYTVTFAKDKIPPVNGFWSSDRANDTTALRPSVSVARREIGGLLSSPAGSPMPPEVV
jgi:hypothetical protein